MHPVIASIGVNMHCGLYDAGTGRMMQADPVIQAPSNLQNYNAYSYVLNNPLSYTDPSGYFFKKTGKFLKKNWRAIASIALGYVTFGLGTGVWGLAGLSGLSTGTLVGWGAASGFVSGAVSTGSLKGALQGAFSGAIFCAIGASGLSGLETFAASGFAGGIMSDIQGGKFGHGFISAGIGAAMAGRFGKNPYAQVVGSAVIGGTISKLTGGKFVNGALSAAFATAIRADWKFDPVPKKSTIAFVGGAADDNPLGAGVVRAAYNGHLAAYGPDSAAYFECTQHEELALWIDQTNGSGTVIAHSYGADMAAQVVADGHSVSRLVTVDPVGWSRPDFSRVAANSGVWQNYDAGDFL